MLSGQFGPVGQTDGNEVIDREARREKSHLDEGRLQRSDHRSGVQTQFPCQVGAGFFPDLASHGLGFPDFGQFGEHPVHLDGRRQVLAQRLHRAAQVRSLGDAVPGTGEPSPRLLDIEVRFGHRQQSVVAGRLDVDLPRPHHLPSRKRRKDGIRGGEHGGQAGACQELILAVDGQHTGVAFRTAVVSVVTGAQVDVRQPQDLGLGPLRQGHAQAGLGRGNHHRTSICQAQGRRQVDRQGVVVLTDLRRRQTWGLATRERRPLQDPRWAGLHDSRRGRHRR